MKNRIQIFSVLVFLLVLASNLYGQEEWVVPETQKNKLSKFEFDDQARQEGEALYQTNCKSCHGDPGMGNYLTTLDPQPSDPSGEKIQANLDGELYYKLRTGRGQMPSFRMVLTPNQIWQVVAYLRSFNDAYVQEIAEVIEGMESRWDEIEIMLSINEGTGDVQADVKGFEESGISPVPGVEIQLFAKRTFGNLLLEEGQTDDQGVAIFTGPKDLPGSPEGKISLIARLADEERYGTVVKDTSLAVGLPLTPVSLVKERAMWNSLQKAPIWLLALYIGGVLVVWGFIFFVMVELRSIFKIGQYFEKEKEN
jgi:mono/diheme cytochrome c family protein